MNHSPPPSQSAVLVAGVARNCAHSVERQLAALREAVSIFKHATYLIIESDSTDHTYALLQRLADRISGLRVISLGILGSMYPQRTARIAHCRNRYLDEVAHNPLYSDISYVVISDLDGISKDINADAIASCWNSDAPTWDVCTANQRDFYYDIWALRHATWCPNDPWKENDALEPILGSHAAKEIAILSRMVHITPSRPMIEVQSAFGGLAIYRREALIAGRYAGLDQQGQETCEHVPLHTQLGAKGYRIFINPAMINAYHTEYGNRRSLFNTLRRVLGSTLCTDK